MFKNRAAQVTFVKTPKNDSAESTTQHPHFTSTEIKTITDTVKTAGVCVMVTLVSLKSIDAISKIAVATYQYQK